MYMDYFHNCNCQNFKWFLNLARGIRWTESGFCHFKTFSSVQRHKNELTSAVMVANLVAEIAPHKKLFLSWGFLASFRLATLLRTLFLYRLSVFLNSWKIASSNSSERSSMGAQESISVVWKYIRGINMVERKLKKYENGTRMEITCKT